jgi:hypothetical protein
VISTGGRPGRLPAKSDPNPQFRGARGYSSQWLGAGRRRGAEAGTPPLLNEAFAASAPFFSARGSRSDVIFSKIWAEKGLNRRHQDFQPGPVPTIRYMIRPDPFSFATLGFIPVPDKDE